MNKQKLAINPVLDLVSISNRAFAIKPGLKDFISRCGRIDSTELCWSEKGVEFPYTFWGALFALRSKLPMGIDQVRQYTTLPDLEIADVDNVGEEYMFVEYWWDGATHKALIPFWFIRQHVDTIVGIEIDQVDLNGNLCCIIDGDAYTWAGLEYFIHSILSWDEIRDLVKVAILKYQANAFERLWINKEMAESAQKEQRSSRICEKITGILKK